ncbi:MAG: Gfo/Idh/MocA family protein [Planctomycetota bacterium]|jgi:predicted dehydrogenase
MKSVSRRRFLEESILATTALLSSPSVLLSAVSKQRASANEKLGVAVIGTGSRGGAHVRAFAGRKDCEVLAVCDADLNRAHGAQQAGEQKQGRKPQIIRDLRHIMDDNSIDCVSIACCNHWHALAAVWALQAGKDVYVEKPVSHNISEGRRIVQAARKYNRICQVGTQYRSDGSCKAAGRYIAEGKLGKVRLARSITYKRRRSIGPVVKGEVPKSVDYNLWAGPAPMSPITRTRFHYDWHWFWETGNGDLGNSDVHRADLVRWGLGLKHLSPAVMCYGGRLGYEDSAQTPNTQIVVHDYGELTFVQEVRGLETPAFGMRGGAIFVGDDGYIGMSGGNSALFDGEGKLVRKFTGETEDHFDNFIKGVRTRQFGALNADIFGGHLSAGLCHLGNISFLLGRKASRSEILKRLEQRQLHDDSGDTLGRTCEHLTANNVDLARSELTLGPWLEFDPQKEIFIDNADADALLTRNYRKPFVLPSAGEV